MGKPKVIKTGTLRFGEDNYKVKSIPSGKTQSCEPVDVTCCDDVKKKYVPGALTVNGAINVVIAGTTKPAFNVAKELEIVMDDGAVNCGLCICNSAEPVTVEADNARELTWTCAFQPTGRAN